MGKITRGRHDKSPTAYLVCGGEGALALPPSEGRFGRLRTRGLPAEEADAVFLNGAPLGFGSSVAKLMLECRLEEASLALEARGTEFWLPLASEGGKYSS